MRRCGMEQKKHAALKLPANSSLKFHRERINSWISRYVLEAHTRAVPAKSPIFLNPFLDVLHSPPPPPLSLSPFHLVSICLPDLLSRLGCCAKLPQRCRQTIPNALRKLSRVSSSRGRLAFSKSIPVDGRFMGWPPRINRVEVWLARSLAPAQFSDHESSFPLAIMSHNQIKSQ